MNVLDKIMKPKSVAVIGASTKPKTIGSEIMQRLRDYKFNGKIYPVNPKGGMIEGFQAYTSILEVPGEVDLAVIVVNSKFVLQTIDDCNKKGIKGLCIITAGFKETTNCAKPRFKSFKIFNIPPPSAPDWETKPISP